MTVLLCEELARLGNTLDLAALERWLAERAPQVEVRRVPGPCDRPERWLSQGLKGAARLVLGVCALNGDRHELDAQARRLGLDPSAIEVVVLGAYCALPYPKSQATEKAQLLLTAAMAKARARQEGRPENAKPILSWDRQVSRRSLFTLPPIRYEVVPSVRIADCVAPRGCRICAETCPRAALTRSGDGRMILNKVPCTGCGACVSACPQRAFDFPGASLPELEAQIAVFLDPASATLNPRGILFACRDGAPALQGLAEKFTYPAGWLPVAVPCIGMVTPGWILQCLNRGAAAVGVLPCTREDCRFGQRETMEGRVNYCRELLRMLGGSPEHVKFLDTADLEALARALAPLAATQVKGRGAQPGASCFGPGETAQVVLGLAERSGASLDRSLAHSHSPLGTVELKKGCTACAACASACPTGALAFERSGVEVSLTFDARLCVGCGECVPVCPESVVQVERRTDVRRLAQGTRTLHRDREVLCEKCGAPVAPHAMLERISRLLGSDPALPAISRHCVRCRETLL